MKKISPLLFVLLIACSPKIIPLKGSYPPTPIIQYSDNKIEKVWDNVIDFFAQKGLSIKIIDKSSGLIISDKSELTWTFENKKGQPIKPNYWVVIPKVIISGSDSPMKPTSVIGEWNVRLKQDGDRTAVNVNLVNIEAKYYTVGLNSQVTQAYSRINGKSTGVFEKMIFNAIK